MNYDNWEREKCPDREGWYLCHGSGCEGDEFVFWDRTKQKWFIEGGIAAWTSCPQLPPKMGSAIDSWYDPKTGEIINDHQLRLKRYMDEHSELYRGEK